MATSFVDEYLIKLGSSVDQSGMARFAQALREAQNVATSSASAIAGSFFKAQTELTAGFLAIGSAAIGLVDKVASADQTYRLFALHMYMGKTAARDLKIAMDALGEPLENLTWDTELRQRTTQLIADQKAMAPEGGAGDYEAQMRKIRDIRFQFTRMQVEGEYLAMHVVNDFLTALGMGPDTLLQKLERFNAWVTTHMPEISREIVTDFVPLWRQIEVMARELGYGFVEAAGAFQLLVGTMTGDDALANGSVDAENFAKSLGKVAHALAAVLEGLLAIEVHTVSSLKAGIDSIHGLIDKAIGSVQSGPLMGDGSKKSAAGDALLGKAAKEYWGDDNGTPNINDKGWDAVHHYLPGQRKKDGIESFFAPSADLPSFGSFFAPSAGSTQTTEANARIPGLIDQYASGPYRALAHALAKVESGERQYNDDGSLRMGHDKYGHATSATGVFQLLNATAKSLGVNSADPRENVKGGLQLLDQLLKKYMSKGGIPAVIAAYHEGEPKMDAILSKKATLSSEAQSEVAAVMRNMGASGDVNVGGITIHIAKPNATNADVGNAVVSRLRETQNKKVQRNLYELGDQAWGY